MIILYFSIALLIFLIGKFLLYVISFRYGKITYDGFNAAGFIYDSKNDLFYSTKDAWQRDFGYGYIYDVSAPLVRIIVDTEPVRFKYKNKNWLIVFWKGQYGITTGGEIGIYVTDDKFVNKRTIYGPVRCNEMLNMSFKLYKKDQTIIKINAIHWWLAAFKLGMFSKPGELSMDVKLTFPNYEMLDEFLKAFKKVGYREKDFEVNGNTFHFVYKKPHSRQVHTRTLITEYFTQRKNKKNVKLYNNFAKDIVEVDGIDNSLLENRKKLIMLNDLLPDFLKNSVKKPQIRSGDLIHLQENRKFDNIENQYIFTNKNINDCNVCINFYDKTQENRCGDNHYE